MGILLKLKLVELIIDSIIIESNDSDWQNVNTIQLRNGLVHYKDQQFLIKLMTQMRKTAQMHPYI